MAKFTKKFQFFNVKQDIFITENTSARQYTCTHACIFLAIILYYRQAGITYVTVSLWFFLVTKLLELRALTHIF